MEPERHEDSEKESTAQEARSKPSQDAPISLELAKADAAWTLRPFLMRRPSRFWPRNRKQRMDAIIDYLVQIFKAHVAALRQRRLLESRTDLNRWFADVLEDALANVDHHPEVIAAAERLRWELFAILRTGFLLEVDRRRRLEASGHGAFLVETAERQDRLREAVIREMQERAEQETQKQPQPEAAPQEPAVPPRTWQDVSITFLSDERVEVRCGDEVSTLNYAELGFEDGRNGAPDTAWRVLRELAGNNGVLPKPRQWPRRASARSSQSPDIEEAGEPGRSWPRAPSTEWTNLQKQIEIIRRRLRKHFGDLEGNPIPFTGGAYQTVFRLGRRRSFDF